MSKNIFDKTKNKILLVEDDEFLKDLVSKKLRDSGFLVSTTLDGDKVLESVKKEKPGLVLLDIVLPGINGFEILKQLKKDPDTASIPVILLTNLGQKNEIEKGLTLGADDYLVKAHIWPSEIIEKVKKLIL